MRRLALRVTCVAAAMSLAGYPAPSPALVPVVAVMARQMVQQALTSMVQDALLGSLRSAGCKGAALANAITALELRSPGALLGGAMTQALPGIGMPAMPGMPSTPGLPSEAMAHMQALLGGAKSAMPDASGPGPAGMLPGMPHGPAAQMPPGIIFDPEQAALLASLQQSLMSPASPEKALETVDELAGLGLLPAPVQQEIHECMALFPQAAQAIGMSMGMLAPVLPKLRQAREQMRMLSPAEQDEFASTIAAELQSVAPAERDAFVEQLGGGFFPPRVVDGIRSRLR